MKDSPKILHKTITKHLVNVSKIPIYQARRMWGGRGGARAPLLFGRSAHPISTRGGAHYPHPVLSAPPDFQTLRRSCIHLLPSLIEIFQLVNIYIPNLEKLDFP